YPAARGETRRLEVGEPCVVRREVALDQLQGTAAGRSALAAEVREIDLVVLHPAGREREVDAQRAEVAEDLVRGGAIDGVELLLDLVGLADVALVQLIVLFHGPRRDAVELADRRELLGLEVFPSHGGASRGNGRARRRSLPESARQER